MTAVYIGSTVAVAWIVYWFVRRNARWRLGSSSGDRTRGLAGLRKLAGYLLTHRVIRRDPYAGVMHAMIFWGFIALLIATTLVGIQHHFGIEFLTGTTYLVFSLGADLGGAAFCAGIVMALWRRRARTPYSRLLPDRTTIAMLWGLLILGLTGFLVEGARIARDFPPFEKWSPVGYATALLLSSVGIDGETATALHRFSWIVHAVLVGGFFVVVPITLLRHIVTGAWNVVESRGVPGRLHPPQSPITGAVELGDFDRLDLLQADACLTCGHCTLVCPAEAAGKPLSPRSIVLGLRDHLDVPTVPLTEHVDDNALWSCTTCNACDAVCPVEIDIVQKIITMRRGRIAESEFPQTAGEALETTAQKFNPFGQSNSARMDWAAGLDVPVAGEEESVELLYWVGCGGAFDPDGREVTRAMIRIFNHLQIEYRVLGCRERCTGDPARRLGEEGLWQSLAEHNQRTIADNGVRTVVTHCPHCFHSLRNEYPVVGPMPEIVHHTQWLQARIADGSLRLRKGSQEKLTYHDPCYLARANGEVEGPRAVLGEFARLPIVEMDQHGRQGFCCGGGGGQMWLDVRGETRVENIRAAHVDATGAQTVVTGCPYCRVMLEAGRSSLDERQGKWRVKDLAELVVENLDDAPEAAAR